MLFNSLEFLWFFPLVCFLYWCFRAFAPGEKSLRTRNLLLLVASYYFYMCWQPKYAILLLLSTFITYTGSLLIARASSVKARKGWVAVVLVLNVGILFFYKYFNFAAATLTQLLNVLGANITIRGLDLLLPVGISFYIFQALGYCIDVYRGDTKVERNFFTYALFVSFFPQLVAGPIERSYRLLRQFKEDHPFDYSFAISGFKLMLWGYFMKLCIADNASQYVDVVFNGLHSHQGYSTLIASVMFTLQIYGDFAGYTFIAIGAARIMGFRLNDNFQRPYFSVSITDFWRRWHISLGSWLRDYVYIPLGGSRVKKAKIYRNLMIAFGISGLWHGANWTFIVWGLLQGVALCIERALDWNRRQWHSWTKLAHILLTLAVVNVFWTVFRANNIGDAWVAISQIFSLADFSFASGRYSVVLVAVCTLVLFVKELLEETDAQAVKRWRGSLVLSNYVAPTFVLLLIFVLGHFEGAQFIYFQF